MGHSLGWVAVHGADPQSVLAVLHLRGTGEREDIPESAVTQRRDYSMDAELMKALSTGSEAIACFLEEHVMYSRAIAWEDGREVWSLTHETMWTLSSTFPWTSPKRRPAFDTARRLVAWKLPPLLIRMSPPTRPPLCRRDEWRATRPGTSWACNLPCEHRRTDRPRIGCAENRAAECCPRWLYPSHHRA